MRKFFRHLLTEPDNQTYDYNRVLTVLFALLVIFLAVYHLVVNKQIISSLTEWILAVLGGGGVGTALKGKFEKEAKTDE